MRDRLAALVLAQALGILAADHGLSRLAALGAGALCLVAVPLARARRRGRIRTALALVLAASAGAAALAGRLDAAARARPAGSVEVTLEGRVAAVERFQTGWRLDLERVAAVDPPGARLPERVRLSGEPTPSGVEAIEEALPGDRLRARVRLRAPRGFRDPGVRDRERALARAGIGAVGQLVHPALHVRREDAEGFRPLRPVHAFRARAARALREAGPGGAFLAALALGDRGGLGRPVEQAFARLGITHLLAVSGLNLAVAAGLFYTLLRRLAARSAALAAHADARRVALAGALVASALYALLAGWGVPVRRALVFVLAFVAVAWRGRPTRRAQPLWLAAGAVLAFEPEALFDAGAQMSFAASAALLLGRRREAGAPGPWRERLQRAAEALLATSALALAATAPIAAAQLGGAAPVGLAANLVFVPWTELLLLPLGLAASLAAALPAGALRAALVAVAAAPAEISLAAVCAAGARVPDPLLAPRPSALLLALAALVAVAALRTRSTRWRVACALAAAFGPALAPPASVDPPPPRLVALDVGQGAAFLVQGREAAVLVDGGTALPDGLDLGEAVVAPALAALGVRRLELVVASHADLDHRGGLPAVLARLPAARLWLPPGGLADPAFHRLVSAARIGGTRIEERAAGGAPLRLGDLLITPLGPPPGGQGARNDRSLVVRVDVAGRRVLLPGDVEAAGEAALEASPIAADVLALAHHGSRTSSGAAFLAGVGAAVGVASAPCDGRFGMPHPEVVARARAAGEALWWTGRDGAVLVGLGDRLVVRGWSEAPRCALPRAGPRR